jgi:hypothetical protein
MVSPVANQSEAYIPMMQPGSKEPASMKLQPAQDSVHLSPQANAAASGDVDHDGDSR